VGGIFEEYQRGRVGGSLVAEGTLADNPGILVTCTW